jgi:triacylglycerol lipase
MLPNPPITSFDPANALACAQLATIAYWSPAGAEAQLRTMGATNVRFINSSRTSTQCFVARSPVCMVIAFRGTEHRNLKDLKTDLLVWRKDGVHRGFKAAWDSVQDKVVDSGLSLKGVGHVPIFVTGHSLGGALAILCTEYLDHEVDPLLPTATYTFGQPRVFGPGRAASYTRWNDNRTFRVVHEEDGVPRLPFWIWLYRHCGQEVFLNSFGSMTLNPRLRFKLLSDAYGLHAAWLRREDTVLRDHALIKYVNRLEEMNRSHMEELAT